MFLGYWGIFQILPVLAVAVVIAGSSHAQNGVGEVTSSRSIATWAWTLQNINGWVRELFDIGSNYEYKN
jgi:hypothetical protein